MDSIEKRLDLWASEGRARLEGTGRGPLIPKPDTMHKPITPGRTAAPAPPAPSTRPGARVGKGHVALSSKRSSPRPSFDASSTASAMDAPAGEATPSRVHSIPLLQTPAFYRTSAKQKHAEVHQEELRKLVNQILDV